MIPVKSVKGGSKENENRDKADDDLSSVVVYWIRQPLEFLFNWLVEKIDIQKESKSSVRD
jgi:hypothetical protein